MNSKRSAWASILSGFGTPSRPRVGPDGEQLWLGSSGWDRLDIRLPRSIAFLLICPKSAPIDWWLAEDIVPRDVAVVSGPSPSEPRALPVLDTLCRRAPAVVFIGGMDPYSVVQYVETRRMLAEANVASLVHGGVNSAWLGSMQRALNDGRRFRSLRIRLARHERTLLHKLEGVMDLDNLLGEKGSSMLRDGYKIEIEGATNPSLYPPSHGRWVFKYLRSRIKPRRRPAPGGM